MSKRKITKFDGLKFKPFDRYGKTIPGMSWHKISYDDKSNFGTYRCTMRKKVCKLITLNVKL